jgi:glycosyltransferase involved in cell wall biosynthesis/SAM-dependent methyltransferase
MSPASPLDKFLKPTFSLDSVDTYVIRTALLKAVTSHLSVLSGTLLDVGCGQMPYRDLILEQSPVTTYVGLDIRNPTYQQHRHPDLFWDGTRIPLADASVDSAIATELFEHLPDIGLVLREIARVLKPGGALFFTVPFLWPLHDSPWDFCRYTPYALRRHLEAAAYEVTEISSMGGWNASLAQMIGLWIKRSGLDKTQRQQFFDELAPFCQHLLGADGGASAITDQLMSPGFQGVAIKRVPAATKASTPRVVVVEEGFPSVSETFILNQITGLIDRGIRVENWALQRLVPATVHETVTSYGLDRTTAYLDLPPRALRANRARWRAEFMRRNPSLALDGIDVFHLHFGPTFVQLEPLVADSRAFVVVSFHGYDASETLTQRGPGYYAGLFTRADVITVPSTAMRDVLLGAGCPAGKILIHRYGVTPDEPPAAHTAHPDRPVRFLTIARLVEKKGIDDVLQALAHVPDRQHLRYQIIGEGPLRGAIDARIRELQLTDCVEVAGFIPHDQVFDAMRAADVFVLTSRTAANGDQEGLPVCLIEAQMLGLPVISTRHAGIPDLVRDRETGILCDERDVPQIAAAIDALARDATLRARYGRSARARALADFNIDRLNDRLAGLVTTRSADSPAAATTAPAVPPTMTVCIPTYNRAAFIGDCLASVLDQLDDRMDILVVDDGSTDDTEAIVASLGRPDIRYIRKPHTNGADTRNVALREATGDFVLWVDSDDLLMPGAVAAHRTAMREFPDADVFYGHLKVFGDTRKLPSAEVLYEDYWGRTDYLRTRLVSHNRVPQPGTAVRRALYDRVGAYDTAFVRAHDYEFWTRAVSVATFKHVGAYTCLWRWHTSNMSSSSVTIDTSFEARVLKRYVRAHSIEALFPAVNGTGRNSALIHACLQVAKAFIKWRDKSEAFAWIERAVRVVNPGWTLPAGSEAQQWRVVELLIKETYKDDQQQRAEFARLIDAFRKGKAVEIAQAFDGAFYERRLQQLTATLKSRPGDIATAEQLKAELLSKAVPRVELPGSPRVTIVIPYYRQPDTIAATLDSVGAQTYRGFDVIIAADGDETVPAGVLPAFQRQHPDIAVTLLVKPHSGLAGTRNWAIERATGDYILPLDADDLLASTFLEKTLPVLEESTGHSFVYTETLFFGAKNQIWSHVDFDPALIRVRNLMTCTTLYRKAMWTAVGGYNENMRHGYEDWDFWISAVERGFTGTNIHSPLFLYRRKPQSMLESRTTWDATAKAQIIGNHPALYEPVTGPDDPRLIAAPIGRIPESLVRKTRMTINVPAAPRTAGRGRLRVLMVCHDFPPYRYAGAQLYALNLAKSLRESALTDVDVLHPVFRGAFDGYGISAASVDGVPVFRLHKETTHDVGGSIHHEAVDTLLDEFLAARHYDAIHIHGLGQLSTAPIEVAARRGVPTVMTLHDYWLLCAFWHLMTPDQQLCDGPKSPDTCAACVMKHKRLPAEQTIGTHAAIVRRFSVFRERFQRLDATIAPSRHLAAVFERYGFPHVEVNPLGLPPMPRLAKTPHEGLVFGFTGQLIARKGIETLLKAFAMVPPGPATLQIWGGSNDTSVVQRVAAIAGRMPRVEYRGPYTPDQLPQILAGIDIAVVPSLMENYPIVVQEAFQSGTPVIASRVGGIPEAVTDRRNGLLFTPGDAQDLARVITALMRRPDFVKALAANIAPVKTLHDDAQYYAGLYDRLVVPALAR